MTLNSERFYGLMACLCSEFRADGTLDEELQGENAQKLAQTGTHGIYCLGATGEGYNVTDDEFQRIVDVFIDNVPDSIVRIVGCFSPSLNQVLERVRYAEARGADAVLFIPPYFVPLNQKERLDSFEIVASACPNIGIIHYNTGNAGNVKLGADDYAKLQNIPNFWGSKQSFISFEDWMEYGRRSPNIVHMPLDGIFVPTMMYGGRGIFTELPALSPNFAMELWNACIEKDWETAVAMHTYWQRFGAEVYTALWQKGYSYIALDKFFYNLAGLMRTLPPRPPLQAVPDELTAEIRAQVEKKYSELLYA